MREEIINILLNEKGCKSKKQVKEVEEPTPSAAYDFKQIHKIEIFDKESE
jgi:hypothetical protein